MRPLRAFLIVALAVGLIWIAVDPFGRDTRGPTHREKKIALTFDDVPRGPGAFYTPPERAQLLIEALRAADVKQAAFFANPGRIAPTNDGAARIDAYVAAGHVIADHTFSHRSVASLSAADFLADVDKAESWLKGRPGYRPWLRFPGLNQGGRDIEKRHAVLDGLKARGLQIAWVTADGSDWNMERLTADAKKAGKPIDEAALRNDGWEIVTADQAFADPVYQPYPELVAANATLPEALAWAKQVPGPIYYDRNDMPVADRLFAERVLHANALPSPTPTASPTVPIKPLAARHDLCVARSATTHRRISSAESCRSGTFA